MNGTAAQNFDPSGTLTETAALSAAFEAGYVHLRAGLCKREVMGTEFRLRLRSEKLFREFLQCSLQIREGNMFVNDHSLDLVERRRVGCVHFVGAEYSSRRDHTDRQLSFFHNTGLYRGGLGTEQDGIIDEKSILFVSCRMVLRNVQLGKVIVRIFYLRSFYNFVSHADKNTFHFFQSDGVWMTVSDSGFLRRKGYVDHFRLHFFLPDSFLQVLLRLLKKLLDLCPCLIDKLSHLRALFRSYILHSLQNGGELAFFSKISHFDFVQLIRSVCFLNPFSGRLRQFLKLFLHIHGSCLLLICV